ncbi:MAG: nucleotide sugar dehydrogenase [Deltaproteobacteria bacterium]|nr:nucleotide sugar dehydrogenase [Deltaproteobacteria bacterium]
MPELHAELEEKILNRQATIGIIGLGYVGLPLVIHFARAGFTTLGFDADSHKVTELNAGRSYIHHIKSEDIAAFTTLGEGRERPLFEASDDFARLSEPDALLICVPTPLNRNREPDLCYVEAVTREVAKTLRRGQVISLESTTYPGTTDEVMLPIVGGNGLKVGKDFFLVYSPEREDPNNVGHNLYNTPKVVGGVTENCLAVGKTLYAQVVKDVVPVSSTKVAEMAKLMENIYRAVNIALVNELKVLSHRMNIDICEVISAAKTKPFGFQAFYPGPGLGGHCIPIDPFYLTWKAREYDFSTRFIELAGEINTSMPYYVIDRTIQALNSQGKAIKGAKTLVIGIAYKKDVDDMRESPSLKLIELLLQQGAKVDYHDPYIPVMPKTRRHNFDMRSVDLTPENLATYDVVLIATDHSCVDYQNIVSQASLVVDTRNAVNGNGYNHNVVRA